MHPLSDLSGRVIGHAIEVHKQLGPGLSEAAYERALSLEFSAAGVEFVRQLAIPITYRARSSASIGLTSLSKILSCLKSRALIDSPPFTRRRCSPI